MFDLVYGVQLIGLLIIILIGYIDMRFHKRERVNIVYVLVFYIFIALILAVINGLLFTLI